MNRFQIVVPSLNQGAFVGEALRSLLVQAEDVDLEIMVVDGVSSDDSLARIAEALEESSVPHVVVSEPDSGQSNAINKGMALGHGEIVGWLNSDDRLLPGALAKVDPLFRASGEDLVAVYGDVIYIDERGTQLYAWREQRFRRRDLLWGPGYIPQPSTFVRRTAWDRVGGVREELHYAMDIDLWIRLSELGRIVHLPEVLSEFRWHGSSKTIARHREVKEELMRVRIEHGTRALGRRPSRVEVEIRHFLVRVLRKLRFGLRALRGGEA
jgi:glycosyltransferase involved in cell wall biosynthesis